MPEIEPSEPQNLHFVDKIFSAAQVSAVFSEPVTAGAWQGWRVRFDVAVQCGLRCIASAPFMGPPPDFQSPRSLRLPATRLRQTEGTLTGATPGSAMPAQRLPMRQVREVLRLKHAAGVSERHIAT